MTDLVGNPEEGVSHDADLLAFYMSTDAYDQSGRLPLLIYRTFHLVDLVTMWPIHDSHDSTTFMGTQTGL